MTDEHDHVPDEEERVRRLLAEAGGPVPTPPDVVARLDETLAELRAERGVAAPADPADPAAGPDEARGPARVTPLAARRRRWPAALLAAAAVVVGGYAVGGALSGTMSGGSSGSAAGTADSQAAGAGSVGGEDSAGAGGATSGSTKQLARLGARGAVPGSPTLSAAHFDAGVRRLAGVADMPNAHLDTTTTRDAKGTGCATPPSTRRDHWFVVRYDGKRATLVLGPRKQGSVDATVYSCDATSLLRTARVEVR